MHTPTLVVLLGPTGVGKTELSLRLAESLNCDIISSDSRQIFRELKIGTAAPTEQELQRVKHHFIATQSIFTPYSAGQYEADAIALLEQLFQVQPVQLLVGGSMMYIDALCKGMDDIPSVSPDLRLRLRQEYEEKGLVWLQNALRDADPVHFSRVDQHNHQRMLHALEVCIETGKPYSSFCTGQKKQRPFNILKIGLNRPRPELYERINLRVDEMINQGLLKEATPLYPHRHLNSLNTVGYKELFRYFDGEWTLEHAIQMIKQDSRHYAKRQLTWFNADSEIHWFNPEQIDEIIQFTHKAIH
ncbi:MAG: tRNA (adenosine(37)-N6)-dimethylallyltransferase MiaA [Paludibacteraceae bacterium]|nr:tRNA (adenosine(37)-N6)-dimethylallyltransferase MiaA [Paludibacteraceae bacterium]